MNSPLLDKLGFTVGADLINLLLGERLGSGTFREVYDLVLDPKLVVKIETGLSYYNVAEWEIWYECPPEHRRWLAPCRYLSPCGTCLIQDKVTPVTRRPAKIPDWMDDNKLSNWGKLPNGRLVCCDYGHNRFIKNGFRRQKLVSGRDMWKTPVRDI